MLLIDFTQIAIGALMSQLHYKSETVDEKLVRHVILNTLRSYHSRFNEKYGDMVLCCDSKHYWRRDYFPNYKANRKKDREASPYNWNMIFECLNTIRDELKDNFPYKVVNVYGAEADDIIATLVKTAEENTNTLIVSSDKDFIQLHGPDVDQYSPVSKKMLVSKDPLEYLREHIIKGDRSDGVPNILSSDDTFVSEKRQKPMRRTIIVTLMEAMIEYEPETLYQIAKCPKDTWIRNWQRNQTLIDLGRIPPEISTEILKEYNDIIPNDRSKLFNYFIEHKLNDLMQNIGDF